MSQAWNGPDPTQSTDPGSYELGVEYVANAGITISAVRVWEGATPGDVASRRGRIWSTAGALLASAAMPTTMPSGWSQYNLDTPLDVTTGEHIVVSYTTGGFYGELNHGLDNAVVSADGLVTAVAAASAAHGNGSFTTSVTQFPDRASTQNTFYGIDFVYTAAGGNTPPVITGMTAVAVGATVTSTINATDAEGLAATPYTWNWGDGTIVSQASNTATHTYTMPGEYAVLGSVTDAGGLSAYAARPVFIVIPGTGFDAQGLTDAVASLVQASGLVTTVAAHEPASLPSANQISAAVWMQGIGPARKVSGLAATAARVEYRLRLYTPMVTGNMDAIDPVMTTAASQLIRLLSADFTLGGEIFAADLLGTHGAPLSAKADYYRQENAFYRIYDITVPLIVDNVWAQGAAS
jgi:hypothetical protein